MLPYPTAERKGENEQNYAENAGVGGYFSSFLGLPGFRLCGMSAESPAALGGPRSVAAAGWGELSPPRRRR